MRKVVATLLVLIGTGVFVHGQSNFESQRSLYQVLTDKMAENYNKLEEKQLYDDDFSKNPLIFKEWRYGQMRFTDGQVIDSLMINYDDNDQSLLVTVSVGVEPLVVAAGKVKSFTFYQMPDTYYRPIPEEEFESIDRKMGFFEQLVGGEKELGISLVKMYVKKFRDADDQLNYGSFKAEDKFDSFERYYLSTDGGKYRKINLGKKTIQSLLGKSKMKEAQSYLKSKNLKWGDEWALIMILKEFM